MPITQWNNQNHLRIIDFWLILARGLYLNIILYSSAVHLLIYGFTNDMWYLGDRYAYLTAEPWSTRLPRAPAWRTSGRTCRRPSQTGGHTASCRYELYTVYYSVTKASLQAGMEFATNVISESLTLYCTVYCSITALVFMPWAHCTSCTKVEHVHVYQESANLHWAGFQCFMPLVPT